MADILRIKRRSGGAAGAPASLANAELAYNETDHTLYIGEGTGGAGGSATVVVPIGGNGLASSATPLMNGVAAAGTSTQYTRGDHIHPVDTSRAPIDSPVFTTKVTLPTWTNGTRPGTGTPGMLGYSSTNTGLELYTTQWYRVITLVDAGVALPTMNGAVSAGFAQSYARADHVHPTDTTLAPLASPALTGSPTAPTVARPNSSTLIANTAFVTGAITDAIQGLNTKAAVYAATTGNITLTGAQTIDGVAVAGGDRVLVKDQTTPSQNGIYTVVQAGAWTRAPDMDAWNEVQDAYTFVMQGTVNADTGWVCTADPAGILGTTALVWQQFSSAGQVNAGAGLTKTGNTLDVVGTAGRIVVNPDNIDIASTWPGQTTLTTLGTIIFGTWNATTIAVGYGGTGATVLTGYVKGNGAAAMTASPTIPAGDITGLGTMAMQNASAVAITGGTIDGITFDCGTF